MLQVTLGQNCEDFAESLVKSNHCWYISFIGTSYILTNGMLQPNYVVLFASSSNSKNLNFKDMETQVEGEVLGVS